MTQEKPNATLAYKVLDHIGANPEQHRPDVWFRKTECGTAGCFAGWSLALSGAQMEYSPEGFIDIANGNVCIQDEAFKALRISSDEALAMIHPRRHLFDADNTYEDLCEIVHAIFGPRPDESQGEGGNAPNSSGHGIAIVPSPKMDAAGLVVAVCSCGEYRSAPNSEAGARKAGQMHAAANPSGGEAR